MNFHRTEAAERGFFDSVSTYAILSKTIGDAMAKLIELDDYQHESRATYSDIPIQGDRRLINSVYPAMGLANEAGEFLGKLKKLFRDKDGLLSAEDRDALMLELGDCLWYLTQLCTNLGYSLEDVAQANYDKLMDRLERDKIKGNGDNR